MTTTTLKDVLFVMLAVTKQNGSWHLLAQTFQFKTSSFKQLIQNFNFLVYEHFYKELAGKITENNNFSRLIQSKKEFKYYVTSHYVSDLTFHQFNRPLGLMQNDRFFFSGKHKLYDRKVEVSVLPIEHALFHIQSYLESRADIVITQKNAGTNARLLEKVTSDDSIQYSSILQSKSPSSWSLLCNKSYVRSTKFLRVIHPYKAPRELVTLY